MSNDRIFNRRMSAEEYEGRNKRRRDWVMPASYMDSLGTVPMVSWPDPVYGDKVMHSMLDRRSEDRPLYVGIDRRHQSGDAVELVGCVDGRGEVSWKRYRPERATADVLGQTGQAAGLPHASLTAAEAERLHLFAEECGEGVQAAMKVLRHGWNPTDCSVDPPVDYFNRNDLKNEMGDIRAAMVRLCDAGDIDKNLVHQRAREKLADNTRMHHQDSAAGKISARVAPDWDARLKEAQEQRAAGLKKANDKLVAILKQATNERDTARAPRPTITSAKYSGCLLSGGWRPAASRRCGPSAIPGRSATALCMRSWSRRCRNSAARRRTAP